jgi:hypothetical protein
MANGHENLERIIRNTGNFILRSSGRVARATGRYVFNTAIPALGRRVRSVARGTAQEFGRRGREYTCAGLGITGILYGKHITNKALQNGEEIVAGVGFAVIAAGIYGAVNGVSELLKSYKSDVR